MASVTANFFNACPILTSDNYEIWVNRIKIAIGCSNYVSYMKKDTSIESESYSLNVDFVLGSQIASKVDDLMAMDIMNKFLSNELKIEDSPKTTITYQILEYIKIQMNVNEQSHRYKLCNEFCNFIKDGGTNTKLNIERIKNFKLRFNTLNMQIDESILVYMFYFKLNEPTKLSFNHIMTSNDKVTLECITNHVGSGIGIKDDPIVINHLKKRYCNYCNKSSHVEKNCWKKKKDEKVKNEVKVINEINKVTSNYFLLDSGATHNFVVSEHLLLNYIPSSDESILSDGSIIGIAGEGKLDLYGLMLPCYHVPNLKRNILSTRILLQFNCKIDINVKHSIVTTPNGKTIYFNFIQNLLQHKFINLNEKEELLHKRLGHPNFQVVKKILKDETSYKDEYKHPNNKCESCLTSNIKRKPFGKRCYNRASKPLELVHMDLIGPISSGKFKYALVLTDEFSRHSSSYYLMNKSETLSHVTIYKSFAEQQTNQKIKRFKCDVGGEFVALETMCKSNGIILEYAPPYSPQLNGTAESANRILNAKVRSMLYTAGVPLYLWHLAHECATYLKNLTLNSVVEGTPYELFFGTKPRISHLKIFGCKAIVKNINSSKFEANGNENVFIGYHYDFAYKVYDIKSKKVYIRRDVQFIEDIFPFKDYTDNITLSEQDIQFLSPTIMVYSNSNPKSAPNDYNISKEQLDDNFNTTEKDFIEAENDEISSEDSDSTGEFDSDIISDELSEDSDSNSELNSDIISDESSELTRLVQLQPIHPSNLSNRTLKLQEARRLGLKFNENIKTADLENLLYVAYSKVREINNISTNILFGPNEEIDVPSTIRQVKQSKFSKYWIQAMDDEMNSLIKNNTWELVPKHPDIKPISGKFIFTLKRDKDGNVVRFKARYVVHGCSQKPNTYNETYAPVIKSESFRWIISYTALNNFKLRKFDIKTAFLNGIIDEDIYVYQPTMYKSKEFPNHICKLKKSVYGLKQAPFCWNRELVNALKRSGFIQSTKDACVWYKGNMIIGYHVDDFIVSYSKENQLEQFKYALKEFDIVDLGDMNSSSITLGINIDKTKEGIKLAQPHLIKDIIKHCNLQNAKACDSPNFNGQNLTKEMVPLTNEEINQSKNFPYANIVGKLNFLSVWTRPDITFSVNYVARFSSNPGPQHINAVKRIVRYLIGTQERGVIYPYGGEGNIKAFSDADWANSKDRKSQSGYILYFNGGPIIWGSKQQKCVATSTMEAEFYALSTAVKELLWLKQFVSELKINIPIPILFEDNQSCIKYCKSQYNSSAAKHIDIQFNFVKDYLQKNQYTLEYCTSEQMVADIFTKPLGPYKFQRLVKQLLPFRGE